MSDPFAGSANILDSVSFWISASSFAIRRWRFEAILGGCIRDRREIRNRPLEIGGSRRVRLDELCRKLRGDSPQGREGVKV
jgi:hypothetical protein